MKNSFGLEEVIVSGVMFNLLVLGLILVFNKNIAKASLSLGLLLLSAFWTLFVLKVMSYWFYTIKEFTFIAITIPFVFGPLVFFYTKKIINPSESLKRYFWIFIPAFIDLAYKLGKALYVYFFDVDRKANYYLPKYSSFAQIEYLILDSLAILYTGYFLYLSIRLIQNHQKSIVHTFSDISKNNSLKWLKVLLIIISICYIGWIGYHIVEIFIYPDALKVSHYAPLHGIIVLSYLYFGYRGLSQSDIFELTDKKPKYQTSAITKEHITTLKAQLEKHIQETEIFLKPDLKLKELSDSFGKSSHLVSQIISQGMETNFYDLINSYRVKRVMQKLTDSELSNRTILSLAFDSGFNSKNAFYSTFKSKVGVSPSAFRKAGLLS